MKILTKIKNNMIGFIIGAVIFGSIGITIAYQINANQISYNKSETETTNVASALTELYTMASTHCPYGNVCMNLSSGTIEFPSNNDTYIAIVYYNPLSTINSWCTKTQYETDLKNYKLEKHTTVPTGQNSGCMKWYVYNATGTTYDLILDHNTTEKVDTDCNGNCFQKAQTQVITDTSNWASSLNARNITAREIWNITKATNNQLNWTQLTAEGGTGFYFNEKNGRNGNNYKWLFSYTSNNSAGYWTQDMADSSGGWQVSLFGSLYSLHVGYSDHGVRPVITIAK